MRNKHQYYKEDAEDGLGLVSPFDPAERDDLWFLPETGDEDAPDLAPLPRADRRLLFDPVEWARAQADLAAELAALCLNFGAFEERLAGIAQGARQRLAIREAAELSWWVGHRIGVERLTLWVGSRSGGGEDNLALLQSGWAVRRLMAGQGAAQGGWHHGTTPRPVLARGLGWYDRAAGRRLGSFPSGRMDQRRGCGGLGGADAA